MRFKEFISESELDTVEEIRSAIHRDCAQYISDSDGLPLYRGIGSKSSNHPTFSVHPKSRDAQASSPWFNFMFNAGIDAAFGIEAVRKKSVFSTGQIAEARVYSNAGFFFPVGNYKFIFSNNIADSYVSDNELAKQVATYLSDELSVRARPTEIISIFHHLSSAGTERKWVSGDTKKGTRYIVRDVLGNSDETIYELLINAVKHVFGKHYATTNIKEAIQSNSEILFYETGGYYHVPIKWAMEEYEKATGNSITDYEDIYKWLIG